MTEESQRDERALADETARRFAVLAHASALAGMILPLGQLLGPWLVLQLAPRDAPDVQRHARDALNFHLSMLAVLAVMIGLFVWIEAGWWFLLLFVPNLYSFGSAVRAATCAARERPFRYWPRVPWIRSDARRRRATPVD